MVRAVMAGRSFPVVHNLGDPARGCRRWAEGKAALLPEESFRQRRTAGEHASSSVWFVVFPVA